MFNSYSFVFSSALTPSNLRFLWWFHLIGINTQNSVKFQKSSDKVNNIPCIPCGGCLERNIEPAPHFLRGIFLSACASPAEGFPIGEYTGVSGRLISFFPDGTYTFMSTGGDLVVKNAPYTIEGNILKLNDGLENVGMGFEGEYEWSLGSDGVIDLKLISERCPGQVPPLIPSLTPVR